MSNQRFYISILFVLFMSAAGMAQSMEKQVVNIIVTSQKYDYTSPWQKGEITRANITGCVIDDRRIVTSAYAISDSVLIEVLKKGEPRKYSAEVVVKDYHCGLAILRVPDDDFFNGLIPVAFSTGGRLFGETARIYKWDAMTNLKEFTAELNKSSIRFYEPTCGVLMHQLSTVMNEGGNGEPVFINGKLVGITTGLSSETKTLFALSSEVIQRMLKDLSDGTYEGTPFFWIDSVDVQNDVNIREYFGMGRDEGGVLVTEVPPISSGGDVLKKNDIILSINGTPLDDNGMYESGRYGKLYYFGLMQYNKFVGDSISMNILRDKKKMSVRFKLKPVPDNCCVIPLIANDKKPRYYIYGGLLLQELTIGYYESWGTDWKKKGDKRLLYYYDSVKSMASRGDVQGIVILNRVLADPVNKGYQHLNNQVLKKVNGTPVRDIGHVKTIIESARDRFIVFEFIGDSSIVLDKKAASAAEKELLRKYNVDTPYSVNGK
jgi:S1-C subfamily serine protease